MRKKETDGNKRVLDVDMAVAVGIDRRRLEWRPEMDTDLLRRGCWIGIMMGIYYQHWQ